jgi:hypothetical protein
MIRALSASVKSSRAWVAALDFCAKRQYGAALERLDYIEALSRGPRGRPLSKFDFDCTLLRTVIFVSIHNSREALQLLNELVIMVDLLRTKSERNYLRGYIAFLTHLLVSETDVHLSDRDAKLLFDIDVNSIDLDAVPKSLKKNFPLRIHPNWPPD